MKRLALPACVSLLALSGGWWLTSSMGQEVRLPSADEVKALQAKYQAERDRVVKEGINKRFLPILLEKADEMAKRAETALASGRLLQASEVYRQARWQLPYQSTQVPDHVSRVLGNLRLRHAHEVYAVAYSPDGSKLATASRDRTVKIWDLANGHELLTYTGHGDQVRSIAFSPNGKTIASAGADKDIKIWDPNTGKDLLTIKGQGLYVTGLMFSKDGKHLIAAHAAQNGAVLAVYDTDKGEPKSVITEHFRLNISSVSLNQQGTILATGIGDGSIQLWDLPRIIENAKTPPYWQHQDPTGATYQVVVSPDNKTVVRVGPGPESIKLYNLIQPGAPFQVAAPRLTIRSPVAIAPSKADVRYTCAAYSRDGKMLFTGASDGVIRLFDAETGASAGTFKGHNGEIRSLVFNAGGTQLASASSDYTVRLWDFDVVLQARDFAGHDAPVWTSAFSPDGSRVVSASADKTVKVWDVASGTVVKTLAGHTAPVTVALYSPDGKTIVTAGGDKAIFLWDAKALDKNRALSHGGTITAMDFSADSKLLVVGGADKKVKVWPLEGGTEFTIDGPSVVTAVAVRADGQQIAVGAVDQTIRLYDIKGKPTGSWTAHGIAVTGLSYSPDGKYLASCGADGLARLWPLNPGGGPTPAEGMANFSITLAGHTGPLNAVAFRKDSQHLVSAGSDRIVKLWKIENNAAKEAQNYRGHRDWITSASFSRDGFYVVSSGVDRTIKIWEITSREIPLLAEHTGSVDAVAVSPDGKRIASAASDKTIKIWDRDSGKELFTMAGHAETIISLTFAPDSKTLVSSSLDRSFRLWDASMGKEIPRTPGQQASFTGLINPSPLLYIPPDSKKLLAWIPGNQRYTTLTGWDLASGTELFSLNDGGNMGPREINCLSFSLDGKLAGTGAADGSIRVWDLEKKTIQAELSLFEKGVGVSDLSFTADNTALIAAGHSGEVKVCKLASKEIVKTLKAHPGRLMACLVSPDGKRLVTIGFENVIKLWDLQGNELRTWNLRALPQDRGTFVHSLAFTPDTKQLVIGNANTTVYVLDLP